MIKYHFPNRACLTGYIITAIIAFNESIIYIGILCACSSTLHGWVSQQTPGSHITY